MIIQIIWGSSSLHLQASLSAWFWCLSECSRLSCRGEKLPLMRRLLRRKALMSEQPALPARRFCRRRSCKRASLGLHLPLCISGSHAVLGGEQGARRGCAFPPCLSNPFQHPWHTSGAVALPPSACGFCHSTVLQIPRGILLPPAPCCLPGCALTPNRQLFSEARSGFYSSALLETLKPFGCRGCFMSRASKDAAPQAGPSPACTSWGAVEKPFWQILLRSQAVPPVG